MLRNGTPASPAVALASMVLPVPGGPESSAPLGTVAPSRSYLQFNTANQPFGNSGYGTSKLNCQLAPRTATANGVTPVGNSRCKPCGTVVLRVRISKHNSLDSGWKIAC